MTISTLLKSCATPPVRRPSASNRCDCISAMTGEGTVVASWSLDGVMPVRWSGPSLNLDSPKVAMETLELAHHGFLHENGA